MNIPRNLSGRQLIKSLEKYGYRITRQKGSHIRITTDQNGKHHITIPDHNPLKLGTLSTILKDVAAHFNMDKQTLMKDLF
jgi:predicted RNA binding protein YcfA (HicA-like mRNA interferase family)